MITNAATTWLIFMVLILFGLLSGLRVVVEYQQLQHLTENHAIAVARNVSVFEFAEASKACSLTLPPENLQVTSCEVDADSVEIAAIGPSHFLGKPIEIAAVARIGYGFYSQISP